ncbi:MAG TPA: hypothetical protein VGL38_14025 [bacterium]
MPWETIVYYVGFSLAIFLCRNLGGLFWIPMSLDMGFNVAVDSGLLAGWDVRWLSVAYGFAIFVWVLALSGVPGRSAYVAVLLADVFAVLNGIAPQLQAVGSGGQFWDATSMRIYNVWMVSISVIVCSVVVKSLALPRLRGRPVDLLTNPKRRFVLPIGCWALILALSDHLQPLLPGPWWDAKYTISAHVLVWGWVALELPFVLAHYRLRRQYG